MKTNDLCFSYYKDVPDLPYVKTHASPRMLAHTHAYTAFAEKYLDLFWGSLCVSWSVIKKVGQK